MINRFTTYITVNRLFEATDRILLAISGGIDSMVMWKMFEESRYNFAIAHCNFQLRDEESEADEQMVRQVAEETGARLFVSRFETREHAAITGKSIEMAARDLRYSWFEEIRQAHGFNCIATAHHQDDLLETFFVNLVRKTGIKGLTGFRPRSGSLIRPMLFTCRQEIEQWAKQHSIRYRTDHTNNELIFQRNFIRHQIIPSLEQLNPAFRRNLSETMSNLRETEDLYFHEVNRQIRKIAVQDTEETEISLPGLLRLTYPRQVLFEWMSRFGFNPATIDSVFHSLNKEPGRLFFSRTHRLVIDRNKLIITGIPESTPEIFYIEREDIEINHPLHLTLGRFNADEYVIPEDPSIASLDDSLLEYPLMIRKWNQGEYFQPLGMKGFKKISDFFVDQKFSIPEKENAWIIYSADKVVWIAGHRIDNRFRITGKTRTVLRITIGT